MTTAATIWLVAAIGMAVGAEAYFLAIFTTVISTGILVLLLPLSNYLEERGRRRKGTEQDDDDDDDVLQRKVLSNDRVKLQDRSKDV